MPNFSNPFPGLIPEGKLSNSELVRAIRLNLASELEATSQYEAQAEATDNLAAQKMLRDIANEEKVHAGEFLRLIEMFTGDEGPQFEEGVMEADEKTKEFRNTQWMSPKFNPLDPFGTMNVIVNQANKILNGKRS